MKTVCLFAALLFSLCPLLRAQAPIPKAPRHWEVTIVQIVDGGCIAKGVFYDWQPDEKIHAGDATENGISMPAAEAKKDVQERTIFIKGLGDGLVDNTDWEGLLQLDGTTSYTTVLGATKTVYAFTLSKARDPVAAYYAH